MWSEILLILSSLFAILLLIRKLKSNKKIQVISYLLPVTLIVYATDSFFHITGLIVSFDVWIVIIATILALVFLLLSVNELKPEHLRYSDSYNFIPFLALPILFFMMETGNLLNIVIMLLQGTGLIVLILFGLLYSSRTNQPAILTTGVILLISAFLFNWFGQFEDIYIDNIVKSSVGVAAMFLAYSIPPVINQSEEDRR